MNQRTIQMRVNGTERTVMVNMHDSLLTVLRRDLRLFGARESCGQGVCGACTVDVDGVAVSSCLQWAVLADGRAVDTIEGLGREGDLDPLQEAFVDQAGFQCGYCTPGMIMMCRDLLRQNPNPTEDETRRHLNGNICRCGAYPEILAAVKSAATDANEAAPTDA
jgi:aerobic-type carbon monoxide dehydrogenase small subunit (CoxS/CutS family)